MRFATSKILGSHIRLVTNIQSSKNRQFLVYYSP